jgi:hypothetical protein
MADHVLTVTSRSSSDPGLELWPVNIVPWNIYVVFCVLTNLLMYVTAAGYLRIDFEGYGDNTKVVQKMSSPGVSFCNCGPTLILTISEGRWTLMDYNLLPAEVKSWILPALVSVSVVSIDWDYLDLRGPTVWVLPAWRRKQSRLPKRGVFIVFNVSVTRWTKS